MKIAILSMQRVINYGSVLQAYSLKQMVEKVSGSSISFIDIDRTGRFPVSGNVSTSTDYTPSRYTVRHMPWLIFRKVRNNIIRRSYENKIKQFQNCELQLNKKANEDYYDLVIIGSDEVFIANQYICPQLYGNVKNANHIISYAAASGMAQYENIKSEYHGLIRDAVAHFGHLSVRDTHTMEYIRHFYDKKIELHVDPVLAGELRFRKHSLIKHKPYLIVYAYAERICDEQEISAIKKFAQKENLRIVCIGGTQIWADEFIDVDPLGMLDYFFSANYVITDTFHGTVFSIINHCRFAVLPRKSNKYKLEGLLNKFGLEDRLVRRTDDLDVIIKGQIDYDAVDNVLDKERERSINYLEECISEYR